MYLEEVDELMSLCYTHLTNYTYGLQSILVDMTNGSCSVCDHLGWVPDDFALRWMVLSLAVILWLADSIYTSSEL